MPPDPDLAPLGNPIRVIHVDRERRRGRLRRLWGHYPDNKGREGLGQCGPHGVISFQVEREYTTAHQGTALGRR